MEQAKNNSVLDNFSLKWSNYQAHVLGVLVDLLQAGSMVDVTLCASGGEKISAHKIVLCAASSFFEEIFKNTDDIHPIVILSDVERKDLQNVLQFIYHGELHVHASELSEVLKVAASLRIRGLTEVSDQLPLLIASDDEAVASPQDPHDPSKHGISENPQEVKSDGIDENSCSYRCDADTQPVHGPELSGLEVDSTQNEESAFGNRECHIEDKTVANSPKQPSSNKTVREANSTTNKNSTSGSTIKRQYVDAEKKIRRESCRKEYSEDQLAAALRDLKAGHLLQETAAAHNIPRSTLYIRAKADGIPTRTLRQEHSGENVKAAVQAVSKGASLQQASQMYQIPKTVLWRRVRAAGIKGKDILHRRHNYGPLQKQAAVQALQNGQTLTKVAVQYQIPKTTLFRERARLIQAGKFSLTSVQKKDPHTYSSKHSRLKEAVAACKEGTMTHSVASITYQVPKTIIWKKLHKGVHDRSVEISSIEDVAATAETIQEQTQFEFIEGNEELPVTYIVEEDFTAASLII